MKGATAQRTTKAKGVKSAGRTRLSLISRKATKPVVAPVVRVAVKALDPIAKCGAGTSVQSLYRVDERIDGRTTTHLVFFDRHGWYCEHGRNCPAVGHARKHDGQLARVS